MTKLDELVTQIALTLHRSAPNERWARQAYRIAAPEDGSYRAEVYSCWLSDGSLAYDFPSEPCESQIGQLAMNHWRQTVELGLPRWYTMTVRVERTGKFTLNFEYLDEYPEGGIHRPVPHPRWVD
ncbi:hypothetical protein [Roseateles asaccharophilus]|uniref:DUF600 family protein n=1 Tax=Roseateles asaccharophilus TaxID=582607 RepID=A0ABU2A8Q9_9BURK|nr:hypothetical protein [Roseateles asaccharophilus]MDR7332983.1 hypothetical protein [Roseateles asaccharophilus]